MAGAFLLPLKLALAYAALIPFISLWLLRTGVPRPRSVILHAFIAFGIVAFVSAFFGIAPARSLPKFINLGFFALSMLACAEVGRARGALPLLGALTCGQLLASLHTIVEGATFGHFPRIFLGEVTEAGQLGVQIPMALGLATYLAYESLTRDSRQQHRPALLRFPRVLAVGALNLATGTILGFAPALLLSTVSVSLLALTLIAGLLAITYRASGRTDKWAVLMIGIALPLLVAALLINLKRGPWLGTFLGLCVFLLIYGRKLLLPLILSLPVLLAIFDPIRERLLVSAQHFFIAGGRSIMWDIGWELASRYPMGIGYHNSRFLPHFSSYIPSSHTHFHNNFLNILVETGWLGLGCFLWWIVAILKTALSSRGWNKADILCCAIGCSIISWQIGGLVEYNFGDSEVVNIVYILIGAALALRAKEGAAKESAVTHSSPAVAMI